MDAERFDRWTQGLDTRLSRRSLSGLAAGALATLGLGAAAVDAKKKNKNKKKKRKNRNNDNNNDVPPVVPPGVNTTCQNLGTACGNTAICVCALDKASTQQCIDTANPPNGIAFTDICQSNINCGPGEVCLTGANVCVRTCAN